MLCCQLEVMKPMVEFIRFSSWTSYGAWGIDDAAILNRMSTNGSIVLIYTLIHV